MSTAIRFLTCVALIAWSQTASADQRGLSGGSASEKVSMGVASVVLAPVASVVGSVQGHHPGAASGLALIGASYVVVSVVQLAVDVVEVVLSSASSGATVSVKLSGKAVHMVGVSVGNTVQASVHASGTILVASGKVLAFIPNALGEALLGQQRLPAP